MVKHTQFLAMRLLMFAAATAGSRAAAGKAEARTMAGGVHAFFYLWYGEPSTDGAPLELESLKVVEDDIAKLVPERIFSLDVHPSATKYSLNGCWFLRPLSKLGYTK